MDNTNELVLVINLEQDLDWNLNDLNDINIFVEHPKKVAAITELYDRKIKQRELAEIDYKAAKAAKWEFIKKNDMEDGKGLSDTRVNTRVDGDQTLIDAQKAIAELTFESKRYLNAIIRLHDKKEMMKLYSVFIKKD